MMKTKELVTGAVDKSPRLSKSLSSFDSFDLDHPKTAGNLSEEDCSRMCICIDQKVQIGPTRFFGTHDIG
jgi:hypothetical protein